MLTCATHQEPKQGNLHELVQQNWPGGFKIGGVSKTPTTRECSNKSYTNKIYHFFNSQPFECAGQQKLADIGAKHKII